MIIREHVLSFMLFALLLTIGNEAAAQAKKISSTDYQDVWLKANEKTRKIAHRIRINEEFYLEGQVESTIKRIFERDSSGNLYIHRSEIRGGYETLVEIIVYKGRSYCRPDKGNWAREKTPCIPAREMMLNTTIKESKASVESTELNGIRTKHYKIERVSVHSPARSKSETQLSSIREFWIDDKGRLLQRVAETRLADTDIIVDRAIDRYEYPPDIRIERPIS